MGKTDKAQSKLQFDLRKTPRANDGEELGQGEGLAQPSQEMNSELRQMLVTMQQSLTKIDGKIDALTFRMDRMTERLDKHTERLDMVERRVAEKEQVSTAEAQRQVEKTLAAVQAKAEDLEARSRRNNLRILGLPESTHVTNMETFIEKLLAEILGRDTFSEIFVIERAHRSLGPLPPPGASPCPIIARLLNYRDRDAALRKSRELKELRYEGSVLSLFPDFTQQVQDSRRKFQQAKRKLQELGYEYAMLYTARLKVIIDGKPKMFNDPNQIQKFLK